MPDNMPLVTALINYAKDNVYPLHTPGHKGGRMIAPEFIQLLTDYALQIDVSLMHELDDLHSPDGCIAAAQDLAAKLYRADSTHFAVNGTSGAWQALILGTFAPGAKLLVARNMHRSLQGALLLGQYQSVFISPEYCPEFDISLQVTPAAIAKAFSQHPDIQGVLLTSPTYYGLTADIKQIASIVHQHNAVLLIDEAHGAHLGFCDMLPTPALTLGADAVVHSTHKSLSSLTQTSMLHLKHTNLPYQRIAQMFSLLTTTSPNYWLLASLDAARFLMQSRGTQLMTKAFNNACAFRKTLTSITNLEVFTLKHFSSYNSVKAQDITKVLINTRRIGYTGVQVGEYLREQGFAVELVDPCNVLFLLTFADDLNALLRVAEKLQALPPKNPLPKFNLPNPPIPQQAANLAKAFYGRRKTVNLTDAIGKALAESITFYPPGIALLMPGEILNKDCYNYIQHMLDIGVTVSACQDTTLNTIQIMDLE